MKIKYILDILNSQRDRAGNCYYAFRFTSTRTGKQIRGRTPGVSNASNILGAMHYINGGEYVQNYYYTTHEMSIRAFNDHVLGNDEYVEVGCNSEELAKFMLKGLAKRVKRA